MDRITAAFSAIKRQDFVPDDEAGRADWDMPLPIGHGQTNSQPTTVRMMLEWLDPRPGQKVLDVGSGSGWTTALLAYLVGQKGFIYAVERIPQLLEFGRRNCQKYGLQNVAFHPAGESYGWPQEAPYERILVSAAASQVPPELVEQLAPEGRLVIPVRSDVLVISKAVAGTLNTETYPGFMFVPLI